MSWLSLGVPDSLGCIVTAPVHVVSRSKGSLSAHLAVSLHLESYQERSRVEEQKVLLPSAGIVVRLSIDTLWHGPNSVATHCSSFK